LGALETLAKALWRLGRFEQVISATDKLLSLNSYEPGYHALRGAALQVLGRYGEACQAYDRSGELPNCAEALRELQAWQAELLVEMLQTDPVFKASYRQDPKRACEAKGFRFVEQIAAEWHPSQAERTWSYTRPS
jgi:tetratricopeptide (TPR) repeat protein